MKDIAVVVFIVMLLGCRSDSIKTDSVVSIKIVPCQKGLPQDTIIVTETDQINEIAAIIENAEREPVKFMVDYRVELNFKGSATILLVRNNLMNNQGITYKLKKDLGKKLEEIIKALQ